MKKLLKFKVSIKNRAFNMLQVSESKMCLLADRFYDVELNCEKNILWLPTYTTYTHLSLAVMNFKRRRTNTGYNFHVLASFHCDLSLKPFFQNAISNECVINKRHSSTRKNVPVDVRWPTWKELSLLSCAWLDWSTNGEAPKQVTIFLFGFVALQLESDTLFH